MPRLSLSNLVRVTLLASIVPWISLGCAHSQAVEAERTLAAAGFQMQLATTPERQAELEKMQPRKLTPVPKGDETVFIYADPDYCKCLYVGDQRAYGRYELLERRARLAEGVEMNAMDMDWGVWGPWRPWY